MVLAPDDICQHDKTETAQLQGEASVDNVQREHSIERNRHPGLAARVRLVWSGRGPERISKPDAQDHQQAVERHAYLEQ